MAPPRRAAAIQFHDVASSARERHDGEVAGEKRAENKKARCGPSTHTPGGRNRQGGAHTRPPGREAPALPPGAQDEDPVARLTDGIFKCG